VIEKNERADHVPLGRGQYPTDVEGAKAASALIDNVFEHGGRVSTYG
jgi:hypothetical protein